jgi:hypothetical protein
MATSRFPRFRRVLEAAPIALTQRDRDIVRRVFEHRFLRSTHILSLTSGSRQQVLRRLQLLFHHGYLDRPRAQLDYYRGGSQPMVYALGNQGMKLLASEAGVPVGRLDWTVRNRNVTRFFMEHAIAVAEALVKIELSCHLHGLEFIRVDLEESFKWKVPIRHRGKSTVIGVVPDGFFGLRDKNETRWFFLEADRGTMPVQRSTLAQTSFLRKLLAYQETWRQKVLKDSLARFQVLTVTTTPAHAKNLLATTARLTHGKGSGLFLFTDQRAFVSTEDVFNLSLLNGVGEQVTLWP